MFRDRLTTGGHAKDGGQAQGREPTIPFHARTRCNDTRPRRQPFPKYALTVFGRADDSTTAISMPFPPMHVRGRGPAGGHADPFVPCAGPIHLSTFRPATITAGCARERPDRRVTSRRAAPGLPPPLPPAGGAGRAVGELLWRPGSGMDNAVSGRIHADAAWQAPRRILSERSRPSPYPGRYAANSFSTAFASAARPWLTPSAMTPG